MLSHRNGVGDAKSCQHSTVLKGRIPNLGNAVGDAKGGEPVRITTIQGIGPKSEAILSEDLQVFSLGRVPCGRLSCRNQQQHSLPFFDDDDDQPVQSLSSVRSIQSMRSTKSTKSYATSASSSSSRRQQRRRQLLGKKKTRRG